MFEDIKKEDDKVTLGDPGAVKDPFDEVDPTPQGSALAAGRLQPVAGVPRQPGAPTSMPAAATGNAAQPQPIGPPQPLTNLAQLEEWSSKRSRRGIIISVILVLAVVLAGFAAAYVFQVLRAPQADEVSDTNESETEVIPNENENDSPINTPDNSNSVIYEPPETLIDTDSDGLTNLEEDAIGTNPESPDTDGDGLNDRDERHVHKTNPLSPDSDNDALVDADELFIWATNPNNPDTDNDTYLDGTEVQNGYSPTGPGRLPPDQVTEPPLAPQPQP